MIRIKISELLGKHKMSQQDLARLTGIRYATVSAMYHETIKRIDVNHIDKICRVFNCQPGDILEYVEDSERVEGSGRDG